jgi:hypothetical protein
MKEDACKIWVGKHERLGMVGRILLKWILQKQGMGVNWFLMMGTGGGLL